jgi:hypothetical protein
VLWDVIEFCKPSIGQLTDVARMLQRSLDVSGEDILASSSMIRQHVPDLSLKLGDKQFSTLQRSAVAIIVEIEVCSFDVGEASPKILKHPHLVFIADIFSPDAEDSEEDSNNDDSGPHNATTQEPRPAPADILAKALYRFRFMISTIRLITPLVPPPFAVAKVLVFEDWTFRSRFSGEEHVFQSINEMAFTNYDAHAPEQDLIRLAFDQQALHLAIELVS